MIDIEKFLISLRGHKDAEGKANSIYLADTVQEEVKIIEEAIAQSTSVQEPVGLDKVYETIIHWDEGGGKRSRRELARRIVDLYTTPPAAQRQWTGLTDEEWQDLSDRYGMILFGRFKNEIETKLREKNTP